MTLDLQRTVCGDCVLVDSETQLARATSKILKYFAQHLSEVF